MTPLVCTEPLDGVSVVVAATSAIGDPEIAVESGIASPRTTPAARTASEARETFSTIAVMVMVFSFS
ncbi:MAG TPA: hypothetical protein VGH89_34295 [Pseudonocardia sp.]